MTEMKSVSVVKWVMLNNPFSCCRAMVTAAPAMNPTMAAWDRNSVTKPNLAHAHWRQSTTKQTRIQNFKHMQRRKAAPEHAQTSLKNAAEERGSEGQFEVILWVISWAELLLQQSPQQKRHHCHRTYGYVAGASQQGVHQRRDETRICSTTQGKKKLQRNPKIKSPPTITFLESKRTESFLHRPFTGGTPASFA
jgi:hypothetical protein